MLLFVRTRSTALCKKSLHIFAYLFLLFNLSISLTGCGFQLRGAMNLSNNISPIYFEQGSLFDLGREIKALLLTNKITQVTTAAQSKMQLILLAEEKSQRVLSVDGSGRVKEYLLIYEVNFEIASASGLASGVRDKLVSDPGQAGSGQAGSDQADATLASTQTLRLTRSLVFDADAVLAVTNEADILYRDMQRDAARLILLKLQAGSVTAAASVAISGVRDKLVSDPGWTGLANASP